MAAEITQALMEKLQKLPFDEQLRVLEFADALVQSQPQGVLGRDLFDLSGTLDDESAREMREAMEEGCENVDEDGW